VSRTVGWPYSLKDGCGLQAINRIGHVRKLHTACHVKARLWFRGECTNGYTQGLTKRPLDIRKLLTLVKRITST
jgi:hypothetical protein